VGLIYTAYHAHSVDLTRKAAELLGRSEDAARLAALHARIREAFARTFFDADGKVVQDTQCGYVLALAYDLLDAAAAEKAAAHLVANIEARGGHLSTGFIGTKDLMLVLSKIGRDDVAYRLLTNETFPSWGFSIRHGATSIWERWDGWTPEKGFQDPGMNSFAHYSFGAVHQWIVENVGGIRMDEPGYARIRIAPRPGGGLTWARTRYDSVRGPIASTWRIDGDRLVLAVEIPPNVEATVIVPTADPASVRERGATPAERGFAVLGSGPDGVRLAVPPGDWEFSARR
jgi:alpha-L-rhamnosidase